MTAAVSSAGGVQCAEPRRFRVLTDAMIESLPDPDWLIEGVLPARSLSLLYGPPASGKTFTALGLAYAVATASLWAERATTPGAVVYVVAEGVAGLGKRSRAWKQAHGLQKAERVHFVSEPVQLHHASEVETFVRDVQEQVQEPIALVVFDTLARCFVGGEENSAKDVGMLIDGAESVRKRLGAAVMLVHHTTKSGEAERGSSALRGAVDTMLEMSCSDGIIALKCEKQKDAPQFSEVRLLLAPVGESCVVEPAPTELTTGKSLQSLGVLAGAGRWLTCGEWLRATELPDTTFYRYRRELEREGLVQHTGGLYWPTERGLMALGVPSAATG